MASGGEEEDLDALRNAVLQSMKTNNAKEESDSDDDLEALRQAALRAKNKKNESSNGTAIQANVGFRPDNNISAQSDSLVTSSGLPGTGAYGQPNFMPRGPPGLGNARFPGRGGGPRHPGGFRGKGNFSVRPSASNLIVIQTIPLEGEKERKPLPSHPINKPLMIRPQDRWAGTGDESSQSPTPKPKVSAKFRRYDSSSSSDSESSDDSLEDSSDNESNSDNEKDAAKSSEDENDKEEGSGDESENEESEKEDKQSESENENETNASRASSESPSRSPSPEVNHAPNKDISQDSSRESSPELSGTRFARPKRRKSDSEEEDNMSPQRSKSHSPVDNSPDKDSGVDEKPSPILQNAGDGSPQVKNSALKGSSSVSHTSKDSDMEYSDSERHKDTKTLSSVDRSKDSYPEQVVDMKYRERHNRPLDRRRSRDRSPVSRENSPSRRKRSPTERDRYRSGRSPIRDKYRSGDSRDYDPRQSRHSDNYNRRDRYDDAGRTRSHSPSSKSRETSDFQSRKSERVSSEKMLLEDCNLKIDPVLEARRQKFESRKEITAKDLSNTKISLKGITSKRDRSKKNPDRQRKKDNANVSSSKKKAEKVEPDEAIVESEQESSSSISSMSDSDSEDSNDAPWRSKKTTERGTGDIEQERRIRAKAHRQLSVEEREERRRRRNVREERRRSREEHRDRLGHKPERSHDIRDRHSNPSRNRNDRLDFKDRITKTDNKWESDDDEPVTVKPVIKSLLNVVKSKSDVDTSRDNSPAGSHKPSIKDRLGVKRMSISPGPVDRGFSANDSHPRELKSRSQSEERSKSRERRVTKLSPSPVRTELPPNDLRLEKLSKKKKKKKKKRRYSDSEDEAEEIEKMPKVVLSLDKPGRRVMKDDDSLLEDARVIIGKKKKYKTSDDEERQQTEESPSFRITFDKIKKHGENVEYEEKRSNKPKPSVHERLGVKVTPEKPKKHKKHKKESKPERRVIKDDELLGSHRRKVVALDDETEEHRVSRLKLKRPQKSESVVQKRIKFEEKEQSPPAKDSGSSHGGDTEAALDAKIREIQRKNEAINQRQKQIQEEKMRFGQ